MRQVKTIAVILGILGVGYVLGFYSAGQYFKKRVEKVNQFMGGRHIDHLLFEEMELQETQLDTLQKILREHKKTGRKRWRTHHQESRAHRDSLVTTIKTFLTEEQTIIFNQRMEEFHQKQQEMRRRFKGLRPPHKEKRKREKFE